MAPYCLSDVIRFSGTPEIKSIWKDVIYTPFWAEIFTVAAELKALACCLTELGALTQGFK